MDDNAYDESVPAPAEDEKAFNAKLAERFEDLSEEDLEKIAAGVVLPGTLPHTQLYGVVFFDERA